MYDGFIYLNQHIKTDQQRSDLKGINQLFHEGFDGIINLVESMHQRIYTLGGILNQGDINKTTGLTRFIYQTIRTTTQFGINGINLAISKFSPVLSTFENNNHRNQWISILNGILGDHLVKTQNPLALEMTWFHQGMPICPLKMAEKCAVQSGQPLILIHGLCMNDQLWLRNDHDHGVELNKSKNMIPIYVRYNTGLAIHQNGKNTAHMFDQFINALPKGSSCDILCHSMGGLVMRSAMQIAAENNHKWLQNIDTMVFLGTPHQGAALEKTGNVIDYLASISPYSTPFSKLINVRSHGIKDLRHGSINQNGQTKQLPSELNCHAMAGRVKETETGNNFLKWVGDGLVSVDSALGIHKDPDFEVRFMPTNKHIFEGVSHMDLLSSHDVFLKLKEIYTVD